MSDQTSVTDLVHNFAGACRALVPNLDQVHIPWADSQQYDNWDRIAESLFESLVLEPCRFQAELELHRRPSTLARYGFPPSGENAFLCLDPGGDLESRFIQLRSIHRPFDFCEASVNGDKIVRPIADVNVIFVLIADDGSRHEIKSVAL